MPRICTSDHSGVLPAEFSQLPESEAARWRHVCAYELGRRHAADAEERLRQRVRDLTAKVKELEAAR
ncbi:MAG TPA: hypothetical protein VEB43_01365 [Anaeromyxobacter sp.]|nr:hypothetical protein [Anaeromyxobacter sp.]